MQSSQKRVKIYFTSDIHGFFYPTSYGDRAEKEMGVFRCSSDFMKDSDTLIIDGGDILQGSAFSYYCKHELNSSRCIAEIMNACGYDYVTLGNHDFNYGIPYLTEYINHLEATCVSQNLTNQEGEVLYPYDKKVMPNGLTIGVIGIVTDYVNVWEKPENLQGVVITDPFIAAKEALQACRQEVDLTIGIYHGGFEKDISTGKVLSETTEHIAYKICEELDFDVLLTGHQHTSIDGQYCNGTYVVQCCENGKEYQYIEIFEQSGKLQIESKRRKALSQANPTLCKMFQNIENQVQQWLEKPIGHLNKELLPDEKIIMALQGSDIANLINQIQLYYSGAQLSSVGLANEIIGFHTEVKTRDIIASYPYPNTLVVLEISGAALKEVMERSAEYFHVAEDGRVVVSESFLIPKEEHYNFDYYAGVTYQMEPTNAYGNRIVKLQYKGIDVRPTDQFSISVNNYRASGAGGYPSYTACKILKEIKIEMVELIMEYFHLFHDVIV